MSVGKGISGFDGRRDMQSAAPCFFLLFLFVTLQWNDFPPCCVQLDEFQIYDLLFTLIFRWRINDSIYSSTYMYIYDLNSSNECRFVCYFVNLDTVQDVNLFSCVDMLNLLYIIFSLGPLYSEVAYLSCTLLFLIIDSLTF